eukprot:15348669-Alexandrium_andersonii.AAC.1
MLRGHPGGISPARRRIQGEGGETGGSRAGPSPDGGGASRARGPGGWKGAAGLLHAAAAAGHGAARARPGRGAGNGRTPWR